MNARLRFVPQCVLLMAVCALGGCPASESIGISEAYAYAPVTPRAPAVAYLQVRNGTRATLTITSLQSPAFADVEMHETLERDGRLSMQPVREPAIKPGETLELLPGGKHLMLMNPRHDIQAGQQSQVIITFGDGQSITTSLTFYDRAAPPPTTAL